MAAKDRRYKVANNVTLSKERHDDLLNHLKDRLDLGRDDRDSRVTHYEMIDRELAGYLVLDDEDHKRDIKNKDGTGVYATDQKLPLVFAQLEDAITYALNVIMPEGDYYSSLGGPKKQEAVKILVSLMNAQGVYFKHYRQYAKFIRDSLSYNFGAISAFWSDIRGRKISQQPGIGVAQITTEEKLEQGNMLLAHDPYNLLIDPLVSPLDLATKGEFFAWAERTTPFNLVKERSQQEIFFEDSDINSSQDSECVYYKIKPKIRTDLESRTQVTDFVAIAQMRTSNLDKLPLGSVERVIMYCWLDGRKFKLFETGADLQNVDDLQLWRFEIINGKQIIKAQHQINAHGMLPINVAMPCEDGFEHETKSPAEQLIPLQYYASSQMNAHVRGNRAAIYGLTVADGGVFSNLTTGDLEAGLIKTDRALAESIDKYIKQFNVSPPVEQMLRGVDRALDLMQKIMPTNHLQQVASLDRATKFQAAATVQAGDRRNLKATKMIDEQALTQLRMQMAYNTLQFQESTEVQGPDGPQEINLAELRSINVVHIIGEGLQSLDKFLLQEFYRDLLNSVLQSPFANQKVDALAIIEHLASLYGEKVTIRDFAFQHPLDALEPAQKDLAMQLLQQAQTAQQAGA